jgi:Flp pilus assembly protein TadG
MNLKNRRKGNAILEFAIIGPVLIAVLFATMDFSRIFYYGEIVAGAARAGTQFALLSSANAGNTSGMQAAAVADGRSNTTAAQNFTASATTFCQCSGGTTNVSCTSTCGTGSPWSYVQVNTSLQFSTIFNYYLLPQTVTVNGSSTVRVQ